MKITLNKIKNSNPKNKLFLELEYMSGDADAYEYETLEIEGVTFDNYKEKKKEIEEFVKSYFKLSEITDCNHRNYREDYEDVLEDFGQEIADLFDNCPGDSTNDGQSRAHLSNISIKAYDKDCNKYEGYIEGIK